MGRPKLNRWSSKYDACIECGTDQIKYGSKGRCKTCEMRLHRKMNPKPSKIPNRELPALPVVDGVEYRLCPGLTGYAVGDDGSVLTCKANGADYLDHWEYKELNLSAGYLSVSMSVDGKAMQKKIHWLVAEAFLGPRPAGLQVLHADGDRSNARLDNLSYGTSLENGLDTRKHGRLKGENHGMSKLTDADVTSIREMLAAGMMQKDVAKKFNVSTAAIGSIATGKSWSHV